MVTNIHFANKNKTKYSIISVRLVFKHHFIQGQYNGDENSRGRGASRWRKQPLTGGYSDGNGDQHRGSRRSFGLEQSCESSQYRPRSQQEGIFQRHYQNDRHYGGHFRESRQEVNYKRGHSRGGQSRGGHQKSRGSFQQRKSIV